MAKVHLFADSLAVDHNGKPEDIDPKYRDRTNSYLVTASLYSPGYNKDKAVIGAVSFKDMDNQIDFTHISIPLEESHLFSCDYGDIIEIRVDLYYVEYKSFMFNIFADLSGKLLEIAKEFIKRLDVSNIAKVPSELLQTVLNSIINPSNRSMPFNIGAGVTRNLGQGLLDIRLAVEKDIVRELTYFDRDQDRGWATDTVVVVPAGVNGTLKLNAR